MSPSEILQLAPYYLPIFIRFLILVYIGVENLLDRIERMGQTNPLWVDVTWNAGGSTSDITLELCSHI